MKSLLSISLLTAICLFQPAFLPAQNLVPNGDFEKHSEFHLIGTSPLSTFGYLKDWKETGLRDMTYCHADIMAKYGSQNKYLGFTKFDTLLTFSGRAMVNILYIESCPEEALGCTSYIKAKLTEPLAIGEVYEVSLWIYTKYYLLADSSIYDNIGFYLSKNEINVGYSELCSTDYFFSSHIPCDKWVQQKKYIRALCPLQYLTIGAFKNENFPTLHRRIENPVFFYVDHVSIRKINEDSLSTDIHPTPYCEYYEKEEKQRTLQSITNLDLHFESNSSTLDHDDEFELDSFYQANLLRNGKIFVIIGNTDSQAAENITLSEARAESVKSYLSQKYNLNDITMLTFGLGSSYPVGDNASNKGRLQNRRTTIRTSDLVISQVFYRKGLDYILEDSLQQAYFQFSRWLRMVPLAKRVEMLVDLRLNPLKRSKYWKPLATSVQDGYSVYFDSHDSFLLDSLYFEDQLFRTYSPYGLCGYIPEIDTIVLPEFKVTEKHVLQKDSLNRIAIQKYLNQNPYPEISKVGRRQARALSYIILHQGDSLLYEKYIPIVKAKCMEGEAEWDVFAMMTDKLHVVKKEFQEYGTQYVFNDSGQTELYKVDDIHLVNERRKKIGMEPTDFSEK